MRYEGERKLRRDLGTATADAAASGIVVDTGSPLINEINTASDAYFDMAVSQYNIDITARAYEDQAAMNRWEGKMLEKEAKRKAITSAVGTIANFGYSQYGGAKTIGGSKIGDMAPGRQGGSGSVIGTSSGYGVRK
jgi:hypothetical protein